LHLIEQADVLDGNCGLICECGGQFDLLVHEGPRFGASQYNDADWYTFA
jgi:hypothetical protein